MNQEIREQLSALIDNELDRDRARFLLKRAEHDAELVALWQRWHFVGEAMRGSALPLRKDFAAQIAGRLDETPVMAPATSRATLFWRWGGGMAVAASVALVALLLVPQAGNTPGIDADAPMLVQEPASVDLPSTSVVAPSPYREQDLRPPYRWDAQTVSTSAYGRAASQARFDPGFEAYWLRHQQAINERNNTPWLAPLRPAEIETPATR